MSERIVKASLLTETDGVYLARVPHGLYEIDGEIVKIANYNGEDIQASDVHNIVPISTASIIDRYEGSTGIGTLTVAEYNKIDAEMLRHAVTVDYGYEFPSLESEFAFKAFRRAWSPITREVQTKGDPLPVVITEVKIDTGSPFIVRPRSTSNALANVGYDLSLVEYRRTAAFAQFVRDTFTSLGMTFVENLKTEATKDAKQWSASDHSWRFLSAFGKHVFYHDPTFTYVFDRDRTQLVYLKQAQAMLKADQQFVTDYITAHYTAHFKGTAAIGPNVAQTLLSGLTRLRELVDGLEVKQKSADSKRTTLAEIKRLDDELTKALVKAHNE